MPPPAAIAVRPASVDEWGAFVRVFGTALSAPLPEELDDHWRGRRCSPVPGTSPTAH